MTGPATYAPIAARRRAFFNGLRPDPLQSVAEWADERLHLPSFAPVPGPWRTSRTPFLKEIMECLSPRHRCRKVVFMKPVQIGGTQVAVNWAGYTMDRSPTAMLFYEPIIDMSKRLTKEKLDPVIHATPTLREKVKEARSRDSGNTTYRKEFLGGFLNILWANSSAGARSTSAPRIVLDEVDEYEQDVGDQGHPCDLIEKRTAAYARYKIFELSTPTLEDTSRIERDYQLGSQGHYHVPCPHCWHYQHLVWERLLYTFDGVKRPEDAAYQCEGCQQLIAESYKSWMMDSARAKWVHAYPERVEETASFHLNLLYQPAGWAYPWSRLAKEYIEAYQKMKTGDARSMKTFTNTILAKTWKEKVEQIAHQGLYQRREVYEAPCPRGVVVLIASVDVQDNRLEATIKGWGAGEQSWSIEYRIFHGSPSLPTVWMELTEWLQLPREHEDGVTLHVEAVGVDTGGHHTKEAYRFIEKHRGDAFALKGSSEAGAPDIPKREPKKHRSFRLRLYLLGTNALKDTIFARMKLTDAGPGFMHFPRRDGYDQEYFEGMTSEVKKPKYKPRSHVQVGYSYEKTRDRNEPLDLEVYNLATLLLWLQQRKTTLEKLTAAWAQIIERAKVKPLPLLGLTESSTEVPGVATQPLPAVSLIQPRPGRRVLSRGMQWWPS
ncbi:MAG TPA: phage terminase large subunit family protein [Nitrospira sp.]|nr:phage terminase large subunit family protein [Nitrospira sp.]